MTHYIFDCDDVLLNWQQGFIDFMFAHGVELDPAGPQEWNLAKWIECSDEAARSWVVRFNSSAAFGVLEANPHAANVVNWLHATDNTISVLTASGDNATLRQRRADNLMHLFNINSITFLPLGSSKMRFLFDFCRNRDVNTLVFVEDNFEHARVGATLGIRSYCLRRSHNRADERNNPDTGVIWIDSLLDLSIN